MMLNSTWDAGRSILTLLGEMRKEYFASQEQFIREAIQKIPESISVFQLDISKLKKIDLSSAWQLKKIQKQFSNCYSIDFITNPQQTVLLNLIEEPILPLSQEVKAPFLETLGKSSLEGWQQWIYFLHFIGKITIFHVWTFLNRTRFRWLEFFGVIERSGFYTLPIIALLSFMIGVVITYQMGLQLRNYGANIFIVDFLGLAILREFGCLLTAIMVAGRTGSAFTAEIGMMKVNQEIDALTTMAVSPEEVLLMPKITGLICVLPLLTIWANVFGVLGGMMMAKQMLGISAYDFLKRFAYAIPLRALLIGLGKAPVFGLIIGSVACFCGMRVKNNVDSVSEQTTQSVVLSIFFVILFDAFFSIALSYFKL